MLRGRIRARVARLLRAAIRVLARWAEIDLDRLRPQEAAPPVPPAAPARRRYAEEFLRDLPPALDPVLPPARDEEIEAGIVIRRPYLLDGPEGDPPYMVDLVRAFRLLTGARCYIEVGTFDKGNLAYAARLLAPDATLIDVDIEARPERSARLAEELRPDQTLETVVGDSSDEHTLARVREILKGREADAVFIDADHCAHSVFADYAAYAPLVRPGGWVLFHDVYWNGDETTFGTAAALAQIDRFSPIHVVFGNDPVHRFLPWLGKQDTIWGGVGIIRR